MKKNIYFLIILLCSISFIRVLFILNEENIHISKNIDISAIVTKIKQDKEKTIIDVKHGKKYRITFYKQINVNLGDKVLISGKFNTPKSNTVFNTFNYRKYLLSKKIILVSNEASITIKHKNKNPFYSFKTSIKNHIEKYKSKAYLKAFIMGDTSLIEENIVSNYRFLGISHLFAISGMHVSVFVFLINKLLKKYKAKDIIIILFLLLFLFITDYSESLLRCSTFFIISYLNKVLKLNIKNIYLILISAFFLLLINPYLIYSIGFLFSVIITFFLYPLDNIYMFFINLLEGLSSFFQNINFLSFVIAKPNIFVILIYYIILFLSIKRNRKLLIIYFIILLININIKYFIRDVSVTFLDVGQGDSSVIILPFGKTILIDTGGLYLSGYNISKNKTVPYLNSLGISKIDLLILTHGDYDHIGDTINLLNEIKVDEVLFNNDSFNDTENKIIKILDKKNVRYSKNSDDFRKIRNLYFLNTKMYDNENDNSTVVYFTYENFSFLFTGDASKEREEDIMENYNIKDIYFLKVGHHGSKTSTGSSFIKNINPKYSIISVGENNRYGHPNKNTLKNLKDTTIFRTDLNGSIKIKLKKNKYEIKTCGP